MLESAEVIMEKNNIILIGVLAGLVNKKIPSGHSRQAD